MALAAYQKIQLADQIVELRGPAHARSETKNKNQLVAELAQLFADAATGKLDVKQLAAKANAWLPATLRSAVYTEHAAAKAA